MANKLITNKGYFLGITKDNEKVYLEKPSWDCDWYWGFGYLEYYNNSGRPTLQAHRHWDSLVQESKECAFNAIKHEFNKLSIDDDKLWKLCDYMYSFYTLKGAASLFTCGNSNQTSTGLDLSDKEEADKINHTILPKLFKQIDNIFSKEDN